jgi:AcrR family transcriptional regulator
MESALLTKPAKDDRRDAIVDIARQAFLEFGYAGTSMNCIAGRVGGSKATLYNYFRSKEDLLIAVVEKKCEQIAGFLSAAEVDSHGDLRRALTDFGEHFVEYLLSEDSIGFYRLAIGECARFQEIGNAIYSAGMKRNQARLAGLLEHAKEEGQLRGGADAHIAAEQFLELCLTGIHRRRLLNAEPCPTRNDIRTNVANAVDTFMRAYGA